MFAGEAYDKLSDTYVIFICDFAPFASELYRYSVRNMIWETKEPLNDGSQTIILSTKGKNKSEVPIERLLQAYWPIQALPEKQVGSSNRTGEFSRICGSRE